jgi:hypothetical protein
VQYPSPEICSDQFSLLIPTPMLVEEVNRLTKRMGNISLSDNQAVHMSALMLFQGGLSEYENFVFVLLEHFCMSPSRFLKTKPISFLVFLICKL